MTPDDVQIIMERIVQRIDDHVARIPGAMSDVDQKVAAVRDITRGIGLDLDNLDDLRPFAGCIAIIEHLMFEAARKNGGEVSTADLFVIVNGIAVGLYGFLKRGPENGDPPC